MGSACREGGGGEQGVTVAGDVDLGVSTAAPSQKPGVAHGRCFMLMPSREAPTRCDLCQVPNCANDLFN